MGAEFGALVQGDDLLASIGWAPGDALAPADLVAAAERGSLVVPGVGSCHCLATEVGDAGVQLLLARPGIEAFALPELTLLRGMGQGLAQALVLLRTIADERAVRRQSEVQARQNEVLVEQLRERQVLLERLSRIQRSISLRVPLQEVFDSIAEGARELLGDEVVGLRLVDENDPAFMIMVASSGFDPEDTDTIRRGPVGQGAGGRAIVDDRLVVFQEYGSRPDAISYFASKQVTAAMAAPVRENGRAVGSLTVASYRPGRIYSASEQDVLRTFAEHASLAVGDAKTVAAMQHQAFHDSLTGLPNRALFLDRLNGTLTRARNAVGHQLAVLFIDVDRFKVVNDSLGHAAGDDLLVQVGRRLRACIREVDTVARLGGDEFAILVDDPGGSEEIVVLAERVLEHLQPPFTLSAKEISVSAAVGVALGTGHELAADLLRNADLAMYRAKADGRGHFALYEPVMHSDVIRRLDLEGELRRAVANRELVLHYQPLVDLGSGIVRGAEALVRWDHPTHGLVPPTDFIPLAEETGLISPIGEWVLREAAARAVAWQQTLGPLQRFEISVNLSARQLQTGRLSEDVEAVLKATGLHPSTLNLELTETMLMEDSEKVVEILRDLKRLGVRLAIDDFGTGYSSLAYLQRFPLDTLKIDRSFVSRVGEGGDGAALATAIVSLARTLGLDTVAEGIEEEHQVGALAALGCSTGQGFLFSRPLPTEAFTALLVDGRMRTSHFPPARANRRKHVRVLATGI